MRKICLRFVVVAMATIALIGVAQGAGRRSMGRQTWGHHEAGNADRIFAALSGSWTGAGTVSLMGGGADRLVCRAVYHAADASDIDLDLRCVSVTFVLAVSSTIKRTGEQVSGTWHESSGISGDITGTISGQRINAVIEALGMQAQLAISVRGSAQAISLVSHSQLRGAASLIMRRQ